MQIKNLLILIAAFWTLQHAVAQNIHFSQFNMSPQTLNPALTGAFQGTVRINGIYREQYRSAMTNGSDRFTTPSLSVDANIMRGLRRKDWISGGIMLFSDKAGSVSLSQNAFKLAAAYHLALDKKATTVLAVGAHYGVVGVSLEGGSWRFADELLSGMPSDDRANIGIQYDNGDVKTTAKDLDAGLLLSGKLNKQMGYSLGFSMFHLLTPKYSLLNGAAGGTPNPGGPTPSTNSAQDRPLRTTLHGQFNIQMNKALTFSPSFAFQTTRGQDEIILQGMFGYKLDPKKDFALMYGLGYRFGEGLHPMFGIKQKDLQVGLAYDINTKPRLNEVTRFRGGFEIAAAYIFRIHKPAVIKPQVLCPRF
jgi:type IX secretion system PorP/SprF family membrane protein